MVIWGGVGRGMDINPKKLIMAIVFLLVSSCIPVLILKVVSAMVESFSSVCLFCGICALISAAFIIFFWNKICDEITFLMSVITFGLQCVILYSTMEYLDLDLWATVVTQAVMFITLVPIPIFILGDFDFDF